MLREKQIIQVNVFLNVKAHSCFILSTFMYLNFIYCFKCLNGTYSINHVSLNVIIWSGVTNRWWSLTLREGSYSWNTQKQRKGREEEMEWWWETTSLWRSLKYSTIVDLTNSWRICQKMGLKGLLSLRFFPLILLPLSF